jgi:hypothetical protein
MQFYMKPKVLHLRSWHARTLGSNPNRVLDVCHVFRLVRM